MVFGESPSMSVPNSSPSRPVRQRLSRLLRLPVSLELACHSDPVRAEIETAIHAGFAAAYGADVQHFLPTLVGIRRAGKLWACMGFANAGNSCDSLLESYLEVPVERYISARCNLPVRRDQLVEIGNVVANWPGASELLFAVMLLLLEQTRFRYAVFTGTESLANSLWRQGMQISRLTKADPARIGDRQQSWGRYYDNSPHVFVGDISATLPVIHAQLSQLGADGGLRAAIDANAQAFRARLL